MLVLTRKSNQSIMIGDNIEVSVLAIMGEKVRIGIQADRSVPVFRKEVYLEIQAERDDDDDATGVEQTDAPQSAAGSSPAQSGSREPSQGEPADSASPTDEPASDDGTRNGRSAVDAALRSLGGEPK
jgi:carbon storage regulator